TELPKYRALKIKALVQEALSRPAKAAASSVTSVEAGLKRAKNYLKLDQLPQAAVELDNVLKLQPNAGEIAQAQARLADVRPQKAGILQIRDEAEEACGDCVQLRVARAEYWLSTSSDRGLAEASAALAKIEQDTGKFSREEEARLLRGLGGLY